MTLAELITESYSRTPTATVYVDGRRVAVRNVSGAITLSATFGQPIASGSVQIVNPPATPAVGMQIRITLGYNSKEIDCFTGYVVGVNRAAYPRGFTLAIKDVLWRADLVQQTIPNPDSDPDYPWNNRTASWVISTILNRYGGITRLSVPPLAASGSAWSGDEWTMGTLTPITFQATAAQAAAQVASTLGYQLYCDASGTVRAVRASGRPSPSPFRTFRQGTDLLLKGPPERAQDAESIYNRVVVSGANTGVEGAQIRDAYQTEHPLLPAGIYREMQYSSPLIEYVNESQAGNASAAAIAQRLLGEYSRAPNVIRATIKADPRLRIAQTVAIVSSRIGYSSARNFFLYGIQTTFGGGTFDQSLTLDGGLGDDGYTTIPPPVAIWTARVVRQSLNGVDVAEVIVDGSGSYSQSAGLIVAWQWTTTSAVYAGTPAGNPAPYQNQQWTFVYDASALESVEIVLTVTDTSSKVSESRKTISLAGDSESPVIRRIVSVAMGAAWDITPDGGTTWRSEITGGIATTVPAYGPGTDQRAPLTASGTYPLLANGGASGNTIRATTDMLLTGSTAPATMPAAVTSMYQNESDPSRVWVAAGVNVQFSENGGLLFSPMANAPAAITQIMEDPAVDNSVILTAGANMYHTTDPTAGYVVLYAGPAGSTARAFARSVSGSITWIGFTGASGVSPLQRVEGGTTVVFPSVSPAVSDIRAVAINDRVAPDAPRVFAVDQVGRVWSADANTGLDVQLAPSTMPAGSTTMHMVGDPTAPIMYISAFDSVAPGTGSVYKLLTDTGTLLPYHNGLTGQQAHAVGFGAPQVHVTVELVLSVDNLGTRRLWHYVNGVWTERTPPSFFAQPGNVGSNVQFYAGVLDPDYWLVPVQDSGSMVITMSFWTSTDAGATWHKAHTQTNIEGAPVQLSWSAQVINEWFAGFGNEPFSMTGTLLRADTDALISSTPIAGGSLQYNQIRSVHGGDSDDVVYAGNENCGLGYWSVANVPHAVTPAGVGWNYGLILAVLPDRRMVFAEANGGGWGVTLDYRMIPLTRRASSRTKPRMAYTSHGLYFGGAGGFARCDDPWANNTTHAVSGAPTGTVRVMESDAQTRTVLAAVVGDEGNAGVIIVSQDGVTFDSIMLPAGVTWNQCAGIQPIVRSDAVV